MKLNEDDLCIVMGDFNLRHVSWSIDNDDVSEISYLLPLNVTKDFEICVVDQLMGEGLNQISNIQNSNKRWLDLVFTNESDSVNVSCSKFNLLPNEVHHKAMEINVSIEEPVTTEETETIPLTDFNFNKANHELLYKLLVEVDWNTLLSNQDIHESTSKFYDKLYEIFELTVPKKTKTGGNHPKYFDK